MPEWHGHTLQHESHVYSVEDISTGSLKPAPPTPYLNGFKASVPVAPRPHLGFRLQHEGAADDPPRQPVLSVAALRRITELEIALNDEKKRSDTLSRQIDAIKAGTCKETHEATRRSNFPPWFEANREDSLARKLQQAEAALQQASSEYKKLEGRLQSAKFTAATELHEAQHTIRSYAEQLRRATDEIHVLRDRLRRTATEPSSSNTQNNAKVSGCETTPCDRQAISQPTLDTNSQLQSVKREMELLAQTLETVTGEQRTLEQEQKTLQLALQRIQQEKDNLSQENVCLVRNLDALREELNRTALHSNEAQCSTPDPIAESEKVELAKKAVDRERERLTLERVTLEQERKCLEEERAVVDTEKRKIDEERENIAIQAEEVDRARAWVLTHASEVHTSAPPPPCLARTEPCMIVELPNESSPRDSASDLQRKLEAALAVQDVLRAQLSAAQKISAINLPLPSEGGLASSRPARRMPMDGPTRAPRRGATSRGVRKLNDPSVKISNAALTPELTSPQDSAVPVKRGAKPDDCTALSPEELPETPYKRRRPSTDLNNQEPVVHAKQQKTEVHEDSSAPGCSFREQGSCDPSASTLQPPHPITTSIGLRTRKGAKLASTENIGSSPNQDDKMTTSDCK